MKRIKDDDGTYLIELELELKSSSAKALLYSDGDKNVWMPRSQIVEKEYNRASDGLWTIVIPEWLAIEKGLV